MSGEGRVAVQGKEAFASIVLVATPDGIVIVREPSKPKPIYPKLPGGMGEEGEGPKECAVRELEGETGIRVQPEDLFCFRRHEARNHTKYFFIAKLAHLPRLKKRGDEGEEPGVLPLAEFLQRGLPSQTDIIRADVQRLLLKS